MASSLRTWLAPLGRGRTGAIASTNGPRRARAARRSVYAASIAASIAASVAAACSLGCSNAVVVGGATGAGGSAGVGGVGAGGSTTAPIGHPTVDKVDLLLAIDNSSSMADKQQILAAAIPDLVARLTNPVCLDATGLVVMAPASPLDPCPPGSNRQFRPIVDMNIGIIDSSLGSDGADQCAESDTTRNNDDHGHLITRSAGAPHLTNGYLAWDPANQRGGITDPNELTTELTQLVIGTGQKGCGYEQQLESVLRFLVDPTPYATLDKGSGGIPPVKPSGVDQTLLQERAQFLRPDSLVAVVMLSDENDCSINLSGPQDYAVLNVAPFFRGASVCATSPNDPCCYSCGLAPPSGCSADPVCATPKLSATEDSVNLRCFHQKQRYGVDLLYPVARYKSLWSPMIDPTRADLDATSSASPVANPLYTDLTGMGVAPRDPGLVFMVGILGVPPAAVLRDPAHPAQGLSSYDELAANGFFPTYVGSPDGHVEPSAPIMKEDFRKRGVDASQANGGDRSIDTTAPNDLQYACIFDLPVAAPEGNDCKPGVEGDNPVCSSGGEPQVKGKAYPGLRELSVLQAGAGQGIAASICPTNVTNPAQPDYGYRPVVSALIERIAPRLAK